MSPSENVEQRNSIPQEKSAKTYRPEDRLRTKAEYDHVLQFKCNVRGKCLLLYGMTNSLGRPRLGRVIGKRWGHAVARNRYRRWVREAFRVNKAAIPAMDIVVMLTHNQGLSYQMIMEDLVGLVPMLETKLRKRLQTQE